MSLDMVVQRNADAVGGKQKEVRAARGEATKRETARGVCVECEENLSLIHI